MTTILVTGASAQLGRPTAAGLRSAGHEVRGLSRHSGEGLVAGDLITGAGIPSALEGVQTLVHLASTNSARDVPVAASLMSAARDAGVEHVVLISIVGIDDIPLAYYRTKVAVERAVIDSGLPHTILRATQFHSFVENLFTAQRFSPVIVVPRIWFQPIAAEEVADRLVQLASAVPAGRVDDIGGPVSARAHEWATLWRDAAGSRRPLLGLALPGRTFAGLAAGRNTVQGVPYGRGTFEQYLAAKYALVE